MAPRGGTTKTKGGAVAKNLLAISWNVTTFYTHSLGDRKIYEENFSHFRHRIPCHKYGQPLKTTANASFTPLSFHSILALKRKGKAGEYLYTDTSPRSSPDLIMHVPYLFPLQ